MFRRWYLKARIGRLNKQVARSYRRDMRAYDLSLFEAMRRAEENDDTKEVWRLGRFLSRMGRGPRRRRYLPPSAREPGSEEWEKYLTTEEGNDCCYPEADITEEWEEHADTQVPLAESPIADYGVHKSLRRLRRQRAVPHWSLPAEVWQLTAHPLDAPQDRAAAAACRREAMHHPSSVQVPPEDLTEPERTL